MKKLFICAALFAVSLNASATTNAWSGQQWYGPFTITKVARYVDVAHRMSLHFNETIQTSCNVTNSQKKVTYWAANAEVFANTMYSIAAAAQAQGKKVMLLLDRGCHPIYGMNLHGVEILSE